MVAEEETDFTLSGRHAMRPVKLAARGGAERSAENAFVARSPAESLGDRERECRVRHAAFARPQAPRPSPEHPFVKGNRRPQLAAGVLRVTEAMPRQRDARVRFARHIGIADERQDWMIERRGGNLNLAALLRRAVLLKHCFK